MVIMLFFCTDDTMEHQLCLKQRNGNNSRELIKDVLNDHKETYDLYGIKFSNFILPIVKKIKNTRKYIEKKIT